MGWVQDIKDSITNYIVGVIDSAMQEQRNGIALRRDYRDGLQPQQLKVKPLQFNDNLTVNYTGLVVDRAVTMLLGGGVEFDYPGDGESEVSRYLDMVWKANRKEILLQSAALLASESGTGYMKIMPDALPYDDGGTIVLLPRLVVLDPLWLKITTNPEDIGQVTAYTIQYNIEGANGKPLPKKQEIVYEPGAMAEDGTVTGSAYWTIEDYEMPVNKWLLVRSARWEYDFAPIIHWQNRSDPVNVYGKEDIDANVLILQDRINFVASNESKIIRQFAHPRLWGKMLGVQDKVNMGPDDLTSYNNPDAQLNQLEPMGDLAAVSNYLLFLRQSLFDISQTIDFTSVTDKVGALTNFGLRVLFHDALARVESKRAVFGEMLIELNRRLLVLNGLPADPGEVVWNDPLPSNKTEELISYETAQRLGVMSKQTIAQKMGLDWEVEQERLAAEQSANDTQADDIGERLLRGFMGGETRREKVTRGMDANRA